jgi:hypothetical protein
MCSSQRGGQCVPVLGIWEIAEGGINRNSYSISTRHMNREFGLQERTSANLYSLDAAVLGIVLVRTGQRRWRGARRK